MEPGRYPRLFFKARHGGIYEGGGWAACRVIPMSSPQKPTVTMANSVTGSATRPLLSGWEQHPVKRWLRWKRWWMHVRVPLNASTGFRVDQYADFCDELWGEPMTEAETAKWRENVRDDTSDP